MNLHLLHELIDIFHLGILERKAKICKVGLTSLIVSFWDFAASPIRGLDCFHELSEADVVEDAHQCVDVQLLDGESEILALWRKDPDMLVHFHSGGIIEEPADQGGLDEGVLFLEAPRDRELFLVMEIAGYFQEFSFWQPSYIGARGVVVSTR